MRILKTLLAGGTVVAAMAAAVPAAAQYPYGYNSYAYGGVNTNFAAQQCTAAVQNRLYARNSGGIGTILGSLFGANMAPTNARVLSVTRVTPTSSGVRVRGLASSGRMAYNPYGAYGYGAYGALGYGYAQAADLSFKCDVDYRGFVRDIDINRR